MKKSDHLPVYGIGPLCVYSMLLFLIAGILLDHFKIISSGKLPALKIPMTVLGTILVVLGLYIWIRAVLIDKVGDGIINNRLLTTGIYAWVRNPIYSAAAICCTGIGLMFYNLWLLILPFICWLDITLLVKLTEEKWLLNLYGEQYAEYCRNVNRVIPWFPKKNKALAESGSRMVQ